MDSKGLRPQDYRHEGFKPDWIYRKGRPEKPQAPDAVRLALWLEVPTEYLFGAAPEYDGMGTWEVASRGSLEIFLKRHPDGRRLASRRKAFEDHVEAERENAPRTVAKWAGAVDLSIRLRGLEAEESRGLDQALRSQDKAQPGDRSAT